MKNILSFVYVIFIISTLTTGCSNDKFEDDENLDDSTSYNIVRRIENERVEALLKKYAKGDNPLNGDTGSYDRLNIAFMTDSHIDMGFIPKESRRNVKDAIDFCNTSEVPISAIIHGGDVITSNKIKKEDHIASLNSFFGLAWNAKMPLLYTKGNHDLQTGHITQFMSDKDWGDVWFDKAEKEYGLVRHMKSTGYKSGYYFYDLNDWKVRIICIDCFDVDYTQTDYRGNILYWGGSSFYVANEQFNWIVHCALNFDDKEEKDWGVIIFTHYYYPYDDPTHTEGTSINPKFADIYSKLNSMFTAFKMHSTYYESYYFPQNNFYNLEIKGNWTRYANLEKKPYLICVLSGHLHVDLYAKWWGTIHLMTANQFCGNNYSDERIERIPGTRSQNLFDILNIDLKARRLRVIRYGASADPEGVEGNRFISNGITF